VTLQRGIVIDPSNKEGDEQYRVMGNIGKSLLSNIHTREEEIK